MSVSLPNHVEYMLKSLTGHEICHMSGRGWPVAGSISIFQARQTSGVGFQVINPRHFGDSRAESWAQSCFSLMFTVMYPLISITFYSFMVVIIYRYLSYHFLRIISITSSREWLPSAVVLMSLWSISCSEAFPRGRIPPSSPAGALDPRSLQREVLTLTQLNPSQTSDQTQNISTEALPSDSRRECLAERSGRRRGGPWTAARHTRRRAPAAAAAGTLVAASISVRNINEPFSHAVYAYRKIDKYRDI